MCVQYHNLQQKAILQRTLPYPLKLSITKSIANNLFSKVSLSETSFEQKDSFLQHVYQVSFLVGLDVIGEIRTHFASEVRHHEIFEMRAPKLSFNMQYHAFRQLIIRSETRYFSKGSIIAECREEAKGLMIITSGQV